MNKNTKTYLVNDIEYVFDKASFKHLFDSKKDALTKDFEEQIADEVSVSVSTVHSWRVGESSPSDIDKIKDLASFLEVGDYMLLLKKKEVKTDMQLTERQKDSIKRIYDAIIDFLEVFDRTNGFNDLWFDVERSGIIGAKEVESQLYSIAEDEQHKVERVLNREYIELFRLDLYEKLQEFVFDYLGDMYNEKLSFAYRFEAGVENVDGTRYTVTTEEDYTMALKKIHEILEPYM